MTIRVWRRTMDFALYVVIGVTCVAGAILWGFHQARTGGSPQVPLKWLGFGTVTAIAFGYAIVRHRPSWGKPRLWVAVSVLAIVQLVVGFMVISRLEALPMILLGPLAGLDVMAIAISIDYVTPAQGRT